MAPAGANRPTICLLHGIPSSLRGFSRHLGAGMAVTMLLTERTEARHQHQQGLATPVILTVGPALAQVTGGTVEAPATTLISQAAQTGGVGGAG